MTVARTIDLDGPVHFLEYDGPGDAPPFVLVHGLGGSHANWLALAPMLARRARVLVPDLAGFGRTPLARRSAAVRDNRRLLDRFLEATGAVPAVVVGNSMGGAISLLQAYTRPDSVAGLALVDPALPRAINGSVDRLVAATFAAYMVPRVGEALIERRLRAMGPERVARQTLELCTVDAARVPPDVVDAMIALARERVEMPWATTAFLQAARSLVRLLARRAAYHTMVREVSAPTLLLMGRADRLVPIAAAQEVARLRPDWEFVVFDDAGHVPMLECPEETFEAIVRWLDGPAAIAIAGRARRA